MSYKLTLEFTDDDLQEILNAATFYGKPLQLKDLSSKQLKYFEQTLKDSKVHFVSEIVNGSYAACANDWLNELGNNNSEDK